MPRVKPTRKLFGDIMASIAIIDADLIGRRRHRFPNLCCMKISGWHKAQGNSVTLKIDYSGLEYFDKVYIAKVFTDTAIPDGGLFGNPLELPNVEIGGTGFFYDKATPLPYEIEHHMPDYNLYDEWLAKIDRGGRVQGLQGLFNRLSNSRLF